MPKSTSLLFALILIAVAAHGAEPATLVKDIFPGPEGSAPFDLADFQGSLVFAATADHATYGIWQTDGSDGSAREILPFQGAAFQEFGGRFFFRRFEDATGAELWVSDGTAAGTRLFKDLLPGPDSSFPQSFTAVGGTLFFQGFNASGSVVLYRTDGTEAGTVAVKAILPSESAFPLRFLTPAGALLFFVADHQLVTGYELWRSDGTDAGTFRVTDINPGRGWGVPGPITPFNGVAYFAGNDPLTGSELWRSDGTIAGTWMVKDIWPGPGSFDVRYLMEHEGALYFASNDGVHGMELWRSDGTTAGTALVADINPGPDSSDPRWLTSLGSTIVFGAEHPATGRELWRSDGTASGTVLVEDINPGPASSDPQSESHASFDDPRTLTKAAGLVFFQADDGVTGFELWQSDATPQNTFLLGDIWPGPEGSHPEEMIVAGRRLYFIARNPALGEEIWSSDLGSTPAPQADLSLNLSASDGRPPIDSDMTLVVTIQNAGPGDAPAASARLQLPASLVFQSVAGGAFDPVTGLWSAGTIASGGSAGLTVVVRVTNAAPSNITAEITASAAIDPDSVPGNGNPAEDDYATTSIAPRLRADLSLSLMADDVAPFIGSDVTLTVTVANAGPDGETGISVLAPLPAGLTFRSASSPAYDAVRGSWSTGIVGAGGSSSLTIVARASADALVVAEIAAADNFDPDSTPANGAPAEDDRAQVAIDVQPISDISIAIAADDLAPPLNDLVRFTVQASNAGPSDGTVVVEVPLPAGLLFVDAGGANFDVLRQWWTAEPLAGTTSTLVLTARVITAGTKTVTAEVISAAQRDSDSTPDNGNPAEDDQASVTIDPGALADLSLAMATTNAAPFFGTQTDIEVSLRNLGPSPATGIQVRVVLPSGLDFVAATGGVYDPVTELWSLPLLPSGITGKIALSVLVTETGPITANAELVAVAEVDADPANNQPVTVTITSVVRAADLRLFIQGPVDPVRGDAVVRVTVFNEQGGAAPDVGVSVPLPPGLEFVRATLAGKFNPATGQWLIGTVAPAQAEQLELVVRLTLNETVDLTAEINTSGAPDPDSTPNNNNPAEDDQGTIRIIPQLADVSLTLTASDLEPEAFEEVTLRVSVTNAGPAATADVVVFMPLRGINFVSSSSPDYEDGVWFAGVLLPGATKSLDVVVQVGAGKAPVTAEVVGSSALDPDSKPKNNSPAEDDQARVAIAPRWADLSLTLEASSFAPPVGTDVTLTATIANSGATDAPLVVVRLPLVADLMFVSATPAANYNPADGLWTVGPLPEGSSQSLQVVVRLPRALRYDIVAEVIACGIVDSDSTPGNGEPAEDDQAAVSLVAPGNGGGVPGDEDGDGLPDQWELNGIDFNSDGTIDLAIHLPPYNARPNRKDIFVEVDWMDCAQGGCAGGDVHGHAPDPGAFADVIAAFAAAPVLNPDGSTGITLHLMSDEAVPEVLALRFLNAGPGHFDDIKLGQPADASPCDGHFGTAAERGGANCGDVLAAKRLAFHYAIFGHTQFDNPTSSGVAELPGNDVLITLGGWSPDGIAAAGGRRAVEAGVFMHELGHNLNLHHGGADDVNCKANYLSTMNYALTFPDIDLLRPLDFSREALPTLNEGNLDEAAGVGGPAGRNVVFGVGGMTRVVSALGGIDWNGDGNANGAGVAADISAVPGYCGASPNQTLTGHDDWASILYDFRGAPDFAEGPRATPIEQVTEIVEEQVLAAAEVADFDGDGISNADDNCPARPDPCEPGEPQPPVANAGTDQTLECVNGSAAATLDGTGTTGAVDSRFEWREGSSILGTGATLLTSFDRGTHVVTLRVTDPRGQWSEDSLTIVVSDSIAPSLSLPSDVTVAPIPGAPAAGAVVSSATIGVATATDACHSTASVVRTGLPAENLFPVGATTLFYSATDASGNTNNGTSRVIVLDAIGSLESLVSGFANQPVAAKLRTAIAELRKSPPDRIAAVRAMEGAIDDVETMPEVSERIAGAAWLLARQLVDEAVAQGRNVKSGRGQLQAGDALAATGKFKKACEKYRSAIEAVMP